MSWMNFYPVFVNHVAESVQPVDLRALFERYGPVTDVVIVAEYGFVNMATENAARESIKQLNGRGLHSKLLHVDFSEEMKYFLTEQRSRYMCTPDPMTQLSGVEHPPYPTGPQVEGPFASAPPRRREEVYHHADDRGGGGYEDDLSHLLHDKGAIDERLRKVNEELRLMKRMEGDDVDDRRGGRRRSRSRGRHSDRRGEYQDRRSDSNRKIQRDSFREERTSPPRRVIESHQRDGDYHKQRREDNRRSWSPSGRQVGGADWHQQNAPRNRHRGEDRGTPPRGRERPSSRSPRRRSPPPPAAAAAARRRGSGDRQEQRRHFGGGDHRQRERGEPRRSRRSVERRPHDSPERDRRTVLNTNTEDLRVTLGKRGLEAREESREASFEPGNKNMKIHISLEQESETERRHILLGEAERTVEGELQEQEKKIEEEGEEVEEYELFVGGRRDRLSPETGAGKSRLSAEELSLVFASYGRIVKTKFAGRLAFINIVTTEQRAIAAIRELSGTSHFGIMLLVQFKRGSKHEHLNTGASVEPLEEKTPARRQEQQQSVSEDDIVIVGDSGKGVKAVVEEEEKEEGKEKEEDNLSRPLQETSIPSCTSISSKDDLDEAGKDGGSEPCNDDILKEGASSSTSSFAAPVTAVETVKPQKSAADMFGALFDNFTAPAQATSKPKEPTSADLKLIMQTVQSATVSRPSYNNTPPPHQLQLQQHVYVDEGPKAQRKLHVSGLNSRIDNYDIKAGAMYYIWRVEDPEKNI